jgi:ABC-type branched-subunit amino acid transport system permease subunit
MFAEIWAFLAGLGALKLFILYLSIGLLVYLADVVYVVNHAYKTSIFDNKFKKEKFNKCIDDQEIFSLRSVIIYILLWWIIVIVVLLEFISKVLKPKEWLANYLEKQHKTKNPQGYI